MKFWPWHRSPDYAIKVEQGTKGKWRWSLLRNGDTVALSPVKGWDTAEAARDAAHELLDGVGANYLPEAEAEA